MENNWNTEIFTINKMYHVHPWWNENHWRTKYVPLIMEVEQKEIVITIFAFDFMGKDPYIENAHPIDGAFIKKPENIWDNPWALRVCDTKFCAWYHMFNVQPSNDYRESMVPFDVEINYDRNMMSLVKVREERQWDLEDYTGRFTEGHWNRIDVVKSE